MAFVNAYIICCTSWKQHETRWELGLVMLVSMDIKIEYNNFTTDTDCMLLLLFLF